MRFVGLSLWRWCAVWNQTNRMSKPEMVPNLDICDQAPGVVDDFSAAMRCWQRPGCDTLEPQCILQALKLWAHGGSSICSFNLAGEKNTLQMLPKPISFLQFYLRLIISLHPDFCFSHGFVGHRPAWTLLDPRVKMCLNDFLKTQKSHI